MSHWNADRLNGNGHPEQGACRISSGRAGLRCVNRDIEK
jgi:hypothetical protein